MKLRVVLCMLVYIFVVNYAGNVCVIEKAKKEDPNEPPKNLTSQTIQQKPVNQSIEGNIIFKNYLDGNFKVELYMANPCESASGFCIVKNLAPIASIELAQPGPFQFFFQSQFKDTILLIQHINSKKQNFIAHQYVDAFNVGEDAIEIDMEKPYPAL